MHAGRQAWPSSSPARKKCRPGPAAVQHAKSAGTVQQQQQQQQLSTLTSCSCTRAPLSCRICAMWAPPLPRTAPTCAQAGLRHSRAQQMSSGEANVKRAQLSKNGQPRSGICCCAAHPTLHTWPRGTAAPLPETHLGIAQAVRVAAGGPLRAAAGRQHARRQHAGTHGGVSPGLHRAQQRAG